MTPLAEKIEKLDLAGRHIVEDLTDLLLARQTSMAGPATSPNKVNFDGWEGSLAHVDPSKSNKELVREAWDAAIEKHMKD